MASARALDVLRRIDLGERLDALDVRLLHMRHLARTRGLLEEAQHRLPVSGFGLYAEANAAIGAALAAVVAVEREHFSAIIEQQVSR